MFRFRSLFRWCFELFLMTVVGVLGYRLWRSHQDEVDQTPQLELLPGLVDAKPAERVERTAALMQSPVEQTIVLDIADIADIAGNEGNQRVTVYDLIPRKHHHHY